MLYLARNREIILTTGGYLIMPERKEWEGFKGKIWKDEINTRDFIQKTTHRMTVMKHFFVGPTDATDKLWGKASGASEG